jgi:ABC-type Fe3+ transport system permease subunit
MKHRVRSALVATVFLGLFGWDLWEALGNLVGLAPFYEVMGIGDQVPWFLLWAGVAIPGVVIAVALVLWRWVPGFLERVAILVCGWALVAALSLSLQAIEQAWRASALQALAG